MSISMLRLAPLSLSLSLAACIADEAGSAEPVSAQEAAVTSQAMEGVVVTMAPITSNNVLAIAASYRLSFQAGGASCATVASDDLTFVTVTFACAGPLATSGTIHLELTSPTTFEATTDLTIGGVAIDGALEVSVPVSPAAPRTLDADLSIAGPRRALTAEGMASWSVTGACLTYSSSGSITAGSAAGSFEVDGRTVCRE